MILADLHVPSDVDEQAAAWGANCGPATLAAALHTSVADVRPLVEPFRGYMGVPQMTSALFRRRQQFRTIVFPPPPRVWGPGEHALLSLELKGKIVDEQAAMPLLLAWDGPWRAVPKAAATYRHWVAVAWALSNVYVYDVNTAWTTLRDWCETTAPQLVPRRGTGGFSLQWAAQLGQLGPDDA